MPPDSVHGLIAAVHLHCRDLGVLYVPFVETHKIRGGVDLNGKNWEEGTGCTYLLPTDPIARGSRVGVVSCFYTAMVSDVECLFVSIKQSHVVNKIVGLRIIDNNHIDHNIHDHILHIEHVKSLVLSYCK